jgi:hypothetical protein
MGTSPTIGYVGGHAMPTELGDMPQRSQIRCCQSQTMTVALKRTSAAAPTQPSWRIACGRRDSERVGVKEDVVSE